jgi:hypothetical protein
MALAAGISGSISAENENRGSAVPRRYYFNAHVAFARRGAKAMSTSQTAGPVSKPVTSFPKRRTLPGERDGHSLRSGGTLVQPTTRIEQWPTGPATTASA